MQVTRHHHLRYLAKLTPFLVLLYALQVILYKQFAPANLTADMNVFLGIGLALIILCFNFYDYHHQVIFRENYLEVRFDILKMKEEILYQNILETEVKTKNKQYGHIVLYLRDGDVFQLNNIDSPELVIEHIFKKKNKEAWPAA